MRFPPFASLASLTSVFARLSGPGLGLALAATLVGSPALAQTKKAEPEEKADEKKDEKKDEKSDETAGKTDDDTKPAAANAPPAEPATSPHDPLEVKDKTYYFIGARFRQTLLPHFMFTPFVDGGPNSVWIPAFGIEGSMRRNSMDTVVFITYSDWSMDPFAFKGKSESFAAWEIITSKLKLIDIGIDMLWSADMSKYASFQYGFTTGIAIVLGDLIREQGKPKAGTTNPDDPNNIEKCPGTQGVSANNPCGTDNNHYNGFVEPSWFGGGKTPNLYLSFGPQFGFRFKPVKEFMGKLNLGWNIFAGPFFGLSGSYGL